MALLAWYGTAWRAHGMVVCMADSGLGLGELADLSAQLHTSSNRNFLQTAPAPATGRKRADGWM
jgi:hypothetical protein